MALMFSKIDKSDVFVIVAGATARSILILVLNSVINTPIPRFNDTATTTTFVQAEGANGVILKFNGSNMSNAANAAVGGSILNSNGSTTKNGSSYLIYNATNIVPCGDKDNPEMLCMNHTQMKVKPGAIRCKDNPTVICYPPHNYTRNYKLTVVPSLTPICTYDPTGVIVCTTPTINQSNR